MLKQVYFGEEYHQCIPLLLKKHAKGAVHSTFQNGFNIKMGDSIIFIGNKKNGQIPFGIHINDEDAGFVVNQMMRHAPVYWEGESQSLHFPLSSIEISLVGGSEYSNRLVYKTTKSNHLENNLVCLLETLLNNDNQCGLDVNIEHLIETFAGVAPAVNIEKQLLQLMDAVFSRDSTTITFSLEFFLGRGKGLTPSGDDLLIGLLSVDAIADFFSADFRQALKSILLNNIITTDVSREFLLYALGNEYSSVVKEAAEAVFFSHSIEFEAKLFKLLSTGHSSGFDTAFGMFIGLLSLRRKISI
ncbi:DUF2877 domain-containing protein [Peribacillus sp. NPDC094092]|uniref:DUF2877 domain-containing protein n=1 Tax=Peribacillus sp. NPDC094092 TaxID=3390611 RepID=UPI003D03AB46